LKIRKTRASEAKKKAGMGIFAIFEGAHPCSRPATGWLCQGIRFLCRSVKLASPEPIKVMVQKNGTDKLIAACL